MNESELKEKQHILRKIWEFRVERIKDLKNIQIDKNDFTWRQDEIKQLRAEADKILGVIFLEQKNDAYEKRTGNKICRTELNNTLKKYMYEGGYDWYKKLFNWEE